MGLTENGPQLARARGNLWVCAMVLQGCIGPPPSKCGANKDCAAGFKCIQETGTCAQHAPTGGSSSAPSGGSSAATVAHGGASSASVPSSSGPNPGSSSSASSGPTGSSQAGFSSAASGSTGAPSSAPSFSRPTLAPLHPIDYTFTNDTVTDLITGLVWQRVIASSTAGTWAEASDYCNGLTLEGLQAWRVPTMRELLSLVDYTVNNPAYNLDFFPLTAQSYLWSSSPTLGGDFMLLWDVLLGSTTNAALTAAYGGARCVHGPVWRATSGPFIALNGTVTDSTTGLLWQQRAQAGPWSDVITQCTGPWRPPNIREMETLLDYSGGGLSGIFAGGGQTGWSSTQDATNAADPSNRKGWIVDYLNVWTDLYVFLDTADVRCVQR